MGGLLQQTQRPVVYGIRTWPAGLGRPPGDSVSSLRPNWKDSHAEEANCDC